jgi:hypothetical protein
MIDYITWLFYWRFKYARIAKRLPYEWKSRAMYDYNSKHYRSRAKVTLISNGHPTRVQDNAY